MINRDSLSGMEHSEEEGNQCKRRLFEVFL